MVVAFFFFGVAAILELFVHVRRKQGYFRKLLASLATIVGAFAAIYLFISRPNVFSILLAVLSAYRIFNMLRVVEQRLHEDYLRNATRTTTLTLLGLQLLVLSSWWIWILLGMPANAGWLLLTSLQVVGGAILLTSILRTIKRTAWPLKQHSYSDKELPTVTVAIPARNETEDLHQCLQSIIASDYPKLEIIVLDDCSQDRRTPEIIREFAQDGVRFVRCEEPAVSWLPKNNAYARLAEEASGAYILFCGVDVRFAPHSIRNVVSTMLDRHKQMISILPMRRHEAYSHLSLIQAMRYWWELVPPRRLFRRPPVISSCWVIKASALQKMGGFGAVARAILPEAFFAKGLAKADGYSFLRAGISVGIESGKRVFEQHATATRMRYPQMHRRPEQVAILTILEIAFLILPFGLMLAGFWISIGAAPHLLALLASMLLAASYTITVLATHVNAWWFGLIAQPLTALSDVAMLHYSMWKYEFSVVDWKGRNVCIPVMHAEPHLPEIK